MRRIFQKRGKSHPKLIDYIKDIYLNKLIPLYEYEEGTKKNYRKMFTHVETFLEYYKNNNLLLCEFLRMEQNQDIFAKVFDDKDFGAVVMEWMLRKVYNRINKGS